MKKRLPFIKEKLTNNWVYKIVALIVALSIWVTTIENKREVMRSREMEVHLYRNAQRLNVGRGRLNIFVKVLGPRAAVKRYIQSTNSIAVNITELVNGLNRIELKPTDFNLPNGLKLESVEPKFFEVNISEVK